jgi:hypothetical protein
MLGGAVASVTLSPTSRGGPTSTPTCPPGQGGNAYADGASSEATKREKRRPSRETEGFLFSTSVIDPRTIQAYLETEYGAHGEPGFTLRVGQACSGSGWPLLWSVLAR